MKLIDEHIEEESRRIFWVIQTIFGFIIGRSFYEYATIFIPPFKDGILNLSLAFVSVYICVLWSWIDFSFTLIKAPYQFRGKALEKFRFVSDVFIVLIYTFLLVDLGKIQQRLPEDMLLEFFIAFGLVYFGYFISGVLRRIQYGKRASRILVINIFFFLFSLTALLYCFFYSAPTNDRKLVNGIFIVLTILLTISYRLTRSIVAKRRYVIGVDVDGVLANQIEGILPIIKKLKNVELSYNDITSWNLTIADSSIDKLIVEEQKQRSYVMGMPTHSDASSVINKIIRRHYIAIATARPIDTDEWTKLWLNQNKISFDSYYNLKEGGKQNAKEQFDVLIDDYIGNIKAFLEKQNGKAILFSQPWNQDRTSIKEYIENGRLVIANNWNEIIDKLTFLLK